MILFKYDCYKTYVSDRIERMPNGGRGEFRRLASAMKMHPTTVSQVFRGSKDLTFEQAGKLCALWGLDPRESEYFVGLVELARAGAPEIRKIYRDRLEELRKHSRDLKSRVSEKTVLGEADRFEFYSEWYYSAIRLLCDIPALRNVDQIAKHLDLPRSLVNRVTRFLLQNGLVREKSGELELGPNRTHVDAESPMVARHHSNWRTRAIHHYPKLNPKTEFAVTSPMTISAQDADAVRDVLLETVEKILKLNRPSKSEELRILNIDWLKIGG